MTGARAWWSICISTSPMAAAVLARNGDSLRVLRLRPTLDEGVMVEGHVFRPGAAAWREGLRLTDVIGSIDELRPDADPNYLLIRRELPPDRRVAILSADLSAALRAPGSSANVVLAPRDRIIVFDFSAGRTQLLTPILEEMRLQSRIDRPSELVRIDGRVKARGDYPLEPGMHVSDLLRAGGGLQDAAYGAKAELTRYRSGTDARQTELLDIDLGGAFAGGAAGAIGDGDDDDGSSGASRAMACHGFCSISSVFGGKNLNDTAGRRPFGMAARDSGSRVSVVGLWVVELGVRVVVLVLLRPAWVRTSTERVIV